MSEEKNTINKKKLKKQQKIEIEQLNILNQEQSKANRISIINNTLSQKKYQLVETGDYSETQNKSLISNQSLSNTDKSNQLSDTLNNSTIQLLSKGQHFKNFIMKKSQKYLENAQIEIENFFKENKIGLTKYLNSGGEGDIFEGYANQQRDIIFKIYTDKKAFFEEIKIHKSIKSPINIIQMIDSFVFKKYKLYILVIEKCEMSLKDELITINQIDEDHLYQIFFDLLDGIIEMRSNKIIHQDIKPGNILKTIKNTYCYTDFGCSWKYNQTQKIPIIKGHTKYYVSPEVEQDQQIDYKSDIYSLGITFKQILKIYEAKNQLKNQEIITELQKIIDQKMISKQINERENCLDILLLIYSRVADLKNYKFLESYQKKIQHILGKNPFSNDKDNRFYQQVYLNYNLINLHIQFIPLYVQLDPTAESFIALLTESCYYEYSYFFQRNQSSIVNSLQNIGKTLNNLGQPLLALQYLKRVYQIRRILFQSDYKNLIQSQMSLEQLYLKQNEKHRAKQMYEKYSNIFFIDLEQQENILDDFQSINTLLRQDFNLYEVQCYLEKSLEKYSQEIGNTNPLIFNYIYSLIQFYKKSGDDQLALDLYSRFNNNLIVFQNPAFKLYYLISIAEIYQNLKLYQEANKIHEELLELCKKNKFKEEQLDILYHKGLINYRTQEFNLDIEFSNQFLQINKELSQEKIEIKEINAKNLHLLGLLNMSQEKLQESEKNFEESFKIRQQIYTEQLKKLIITKNDIGHVYFSQQDFKKALIYYEDSHRLAKKIFDIDNELACECSFNVGLTYFEMNQNEKALNYLDQCYEISKCVENLKYNALCLSTKANYFYKQGEKNLTEQYMKESIGILKDTDDTLHLDIATYQQNLGLFYQQEKQYDQALKYLKNCYKIRKIYYDGFHQKKIEILLNIIDNYEEVTKKKQTIEEATKMALKKEKYIRELQKNIFNLTKFEQKGKDQINNEKLQADQVLQFQECQLIKISINQHLAFDFKIVKYLFSQCSNLISLTLDIDATNLKNESLTSLFDGFKYLINLDNLSVSFNNQLIDEEGNIRQFSSFFKHLANLQRLYIFIGSNNVANFQHLQDFVINFQYLKHLQQLSLIIEGGKLTDSLLLSIINNGVQRIDSLKVLVFIINSFRKNQSYDLDKVKNKFQEIQRLYFRLSCESDVIGKDKQKKVFNLNKCKGNFKRTIQINDKYLKNNETLFNRKKSVCLNDDIINFDYENFIQQITTMFNLKKQQIKIKFLKFDEKLFNVEEINDNNLSYSHLDQQINGLTPILQSLNEFSFSIFLQQEINFIEIGKHISKFSNLTVLKLSLLIFYNSNNNNYQGVTCLFEGIANITNLVNLEFVIKRGDTEYTLLFNKQTIKYFENDPFNNIKSDFKKLINLKQLTFTISQNCYMDRQSALFLSKGLIELKNLEKLEIRIYLQNEIVIQGMVELGNSLKSLTKLQSLSIDLRQNQLENEMIKSIGEGISQLHLLSDLNIYYYRQDLGSEVIQVLFQGIQNLINLKKLSLSLTIFSKLDIRDLEIIQKCFSKLINLQNVSLQINDFIKNYHPNTYDLIFKELKKINKLTNFNLYLGEPKNCSQLFKEVQNCIQDQINLVDLSIEIYHHDIKNKYLLSISQGISNLLNLQTLFIKLGNIDNESMQKFSKNIQKLTRLTKLTLLLYFNNKQFDREVVKGFATALKQLPNLTYLSLRLGSKYIEEKQSINQVIKAIFNLTSLIHLELILKSVNFAKNEVEIEQFKKLNKPLSITSLKIVIERDENCVFENKDIQELREFISSFVNLNTLHLKINQKIEQQGIISIVQGLKQLQNLQKLKLKINLIDIDEQGLREVKNQLKQQNNLNKVKLIIINNRIKEDNFWLDYENLETSLDQLNSDLYSYDQSQQNEEYAQLVKLTYVTEIKNDLSTLYNFHYNFKEIFLNFDFENNKISLTLHGLLNCKILMNYFAQGCQESMDALWQKFKTLQIVAFKDFFTKSERTIRQCKNLQIFSFIQHFQIEFKRGQISKEGAIEIGSGLKGLTKLKSLIIKIEGNPIGDEGVIRLTEGIKSLINLTILQFTMIENQVGNDGVQHFMYSLKHLINLKELLIVFDDNLNDCLGMKAFAEGFQYLQNITNFQFLVNQYFYFEEEIVDFDDENFFDKIGLNEFEQQNSNSILQIISLEQSVDYPQVETISYRSSKDQISCESYKNDVDFLNLYQKNLDLNQQIEEMEQEPFEIILENLNSLNNSCDQIKNDKDHLDMDQNILYQNQQLKEMEQEPFTIITENFNSLKNSCDQIKNDEDHLDLDQNQLIQNQQLNELNDSSYSIQALTIPDQNKLDYFQQSEEKQYNSYRIISENLKYLVNLNNLTFTIKSDRYQICNSRVIESIFKSLKNLQYLNFSILGGFNKKNIACYIGEGIKQLKQLIYLQFEIQKRFIGGGGFLEICAGIKQLENLQTLKCDIYKRTCIGDRGAIALLEIINDLTNLNELTFFYGKNYITENGAKAIAQQIQILKKLSNFQFKIYDNKIGSEGAQELQKATLLFAQTYNLQNKQFSFEDEKNIYFLQ